MTDVKVPSPPGKAGSRLPSAPPAPQEAPQNMGTPNGDKLADMNFKVSPSLKNRVKLEAAARGMSMKDLCEAAFRLYFDTHPVKIQQDELF